MQVDLDARDSLIREMGAETEKKESEIYRLTAELRNLKCQLQEVPESQVGQKKQPHMQMIILLIVYNIRLITKF